VALHRRDTRKALLDAGLAMLSELTAADLVAAMRTRAVATRAGVSPPAFFHHFDSVEAYADALVDLAFTIPAGGLRGTVVDGLRDAQRAQSPAQQSVSYHARDLEQLSSDASHRARLGLWALGGPKADVAFARFQAEAERQLLPQAQALHRAWGREVRPPFDLQSYLALQIGLLYGASIRHVLDPSVVSVERYARAASAFSIVTLRPVGDRRTMDDRLAEMNWLPAPPGPKGSGGQRRQATRARLLDAAGDLFGDHGYEATSIAQLARAAGVHVATLYDHFPSKAHIGMVLLNQRAEQALAAGVAAPHLDARARLSLHLEALAELAQTHEQIARVYLAALACGDQAAAAAHTIFSSTMQRLADVEPTATEAENERAAEQVLVATIGAMLRHPGDGPASAAAAGIRQVG
jgi:AcrR family transcriptional regulator